MPTTEVLVSGFQIFPWSDKFATGIESIDIQHRRLVDLLNKLAVHLAGYSDILTLQTVLDELSDYAVCHFTTEEGLWTQYLGADALVAEHVQTHLGFVSEVGRIRAQLTSSDKDEVIEEVVSFLTHWLAFHILETDTTMAHIVCHVQEGKSLEEAKRLATEHMQGSARVLIEAVLHMYDILSSRTLALLREINQRRLAEARLRLASNIIESSADAIFITDEQGLITDANRAFLQDVKRSREALLGQAISVVKPGLLANQEKDIWGMATQTGHWAGELSDHQADGTTEAVWLSLSTVHDELQGSTHYVGIVSSISQLVERHHALEAAANFDVLTGLPNRRLLTDRLAQALERSKREGKLLAVCFMDLDGFKQINDSLGHDAGDLVLQVIAKRLTHTLRSSDTVARIGGDEFVLLLADLAQAQEAMSLLERVLRDVAQAIELPQQSVQVGISIGVTLYPDDVASAEDLLKHADTALYRAKSDGKGRIFRYTPDQARAGAKP